MRVGLYPALPHSVQDVTGNGRFDDISAPPSTVTRTTGCFIASPLEPGSSKQLFAALEAGRNFRMSGLLSVSIYDLVVYSDFVTPRKQES